MLFVKVSLLLQGVLVYIYINIWNIHTFGDWLLGYVNIFHPPTIENWMFSVIYIFWTLILQADQILCTIYAYVYSNVFGKILFPVGRYAYSLKQIIWPLVSLAYRELVPVLLWNLMPFMPLSADWEIGNVMQHIVTPLWQSFLLAINAI